MEELDLDRVFGTAVSYHFMNWACNMVTRREEMNAYPFEVSVQEFTWAMRILKDKGTS